MSGRNADARDARQAREALGSLAGPADALSGLLAPGEDLVRFLNRTPEDLPLVAFSPFAGLAGGAVQAPMAARRVAEPARPAGRAPVVKPAEEPERRRFAADPAEAPGRVREAPISAAPPVFPLRRQVEGDREARAPRPRQGVEIEPVFTGRSLSLSELLALKSREVPAPLAVAERGRTARFSEAPSVSPIQRKGVSEDRDPRGALPFGDLTPAPLLKERDLDPGLPPDPLGSPGELTELMERRTSRHKTSLSFRRGTEGEVFEGQGAAQATGAKNVPFFPGDLPRETGTSRQGSLGIEEGFSGGPTGRDSSAQGNALGRVDGTASGKARDRFHEPGPMGDEGSSSGRSHEPSPMGWAEETQAVGPETLLNDLADRALWLPDMPLPDRGQPSAEPSAPRPRTPVRIAEAPGPQPSPFPAAPPAPALPDAETLADLVNEALVEQARRHGVDLS